MDKPRYYTIVNGAAGGGRCRSRADQALYRLRDAGLDLSVHLTEGPGHATELAKDAYDAGERRFLSVGGDGTSYEILNGIFPKADGDEDEVVLGMLPLGTGNSFLRDFGILHEEAALDALERGATRPVDLVRADHQDGVIHYINLLSIGFVAQVGDLTNRRLKPLGAGGYAVSVLANVARLRFPVDPLRLDDDEDVDRRPAAFLSFSNSRYTGGAMMMAPEADPADGELDVIRVGVLSRPSLVATFPKIFAGTHIDHPAVEQARAQTVELVQPRRQPVMVDGEVIELAVERLTVLPGAISVVA